MWYVVRGKGTCEGWKVCERGVAAVRNATEVAVRSISRHAQPIILNPTREHPFARVNTAGVERAKQMCARQELLASAHDLVCGSRRV